MTIKRTVICTIATNAIPLFLSDKSQLNDLINAGHRIVAICSDSTRKLIGNCYTITDSFNVIELNDASSNIVEALNNTLKEITDWQESDLLIVNDASISLKPSDIDALQRDMYSFDRYSLGSPRMNIDGWVYLKPENVDFASNTLPTITRIPYPASACTYIKGHHLALLGPLDEKLNTLQAALCDYALNANEYGFDSVMLNHVFFDVLNPNETPSSVISIADADYATLISRRKYLNNLIARFENTGIDPINRFIDVYQISDNRKPKILLDYSNIPALHAGTSEYQIALLRYINELYKDKYELHVFASEKGARFHNIQQYCDCVTFDKADLTTYDLGIYAAQPTEISQQIILDVHCARIVYIMFDSILLRCSYINFSRSDAIAAVESVRCGLENCDGIVSISRYSNNDCLNYFQDDSIIQSKPIRQIYISTDFGNPDMGYHSSSIDFIPFSDYVLLAGNPWFKHKALHEAIEAIKDMNENFVVIGFGNDSLIHPNVYGCSYGFLSNETLFELYQQCKAFVFPSVYEGFGLPIINALKCGKNVVVNNNPLNRELQEHLGIESEHFITFNTFDELPLAINKALETRDNEFIYRDSWNNHVEQLASFLDELLAKPLDYSWLRERHHHYAIHWQMLARQQQEEADSNQPLKTLIMTRVFTKLIQSHPRRLAIWRKLKPIKN